MTNMRRLANSLPFLFMISDYFIYQTCSSNTWSIINCYFLFTFPVIFSTFLFYSRFRNERYLSLVLFFANLCNAFWSMIGILLVKHYPIEQYLWIRFFTHTGCSWYFYTSLLNYYH